MPLAKKMVKWPEMARNSRRMREIRGKYRTDYYNSTSANYLIQCNT